MIAPKSEQELSQVLRDATAPLCIRGGGTRIRHVLGETLSTQNLSGITLYEPRALTIVAGAGTPLSKVSSTLAKEGQRLSFEPPDLRGLLGTTGEPTIGGVAAANASGPRRIQSGAARDSFIGVRFVDGLGNIVKNGGRVMKNVTGYDLVKLMAGSHGTLGVLTEVAFKVLPSPPTRVTLLFEGLTPDHAVDAMSMALASPYDVNGAAHTTAGVDGDPVTMIRIEGFEGSVAHRAEALSQRLKNVGRIAVETDREKTGAGWAWVRDVAAFKDKPGAVWRISVKPSDAPDAINRLDATGILMDWGGGLIWALVQANTDIRPRLTGISGHATLVRASGITHSNIPRFQPEPAELAALTRGLRQKFDPRGILNPGMMG